jgi:hypothetical protein
LRLLCSSYHAAASKKEPSLVEALKLPPLFGVLSQEEQRYSRENSFTLISCNPLSFPQPTMISEWGALSPNPLLDGRTFPLRLRIANQVNRYVIAIQYQPIEHECEIDVGN